MICYVVNEREAETVRAIFDMYAKGEGYRAILEQVAGAKGKRGKPLGKNSLHSILTNERYIGTYTWNKRRVKQMRKWAGGTPNPNCVRIEGQIPPIIDINTWERVQKRMKDNKRKAANKAKREYLLSGLIECEQCGATFVGHTSVNGRGYEHKTYVCGNKYRTRTCKAHNGNADELETFVVANLKDYLNKMDFEDMAGVIADKVNAASADLSKERKELSDITAQINNGVKAILGGMVMPELEAEVNALRIRKSELEDIIARNASNAQKMDKNKLVEFLKYSAANMDGNTKEAVKQHITKIYAHTDGSFTVNVGVHIAGI